MTDWLSLRFTEVRPIDAGVDLVRDRLAPTGAPLRVRKRASGDAERKALRRELEELAALSHPAIRRLIAHDENDEASVIVLEHVEGEDLASHLARHPRDARRCAIELLRALLYLHARGRV